MSDFPQDAEPVGEQRPSLFKRVIGLIHNVWPKTDETESYRALSRFKLKAEEMISGPLPEDVLHAAALYEEALKIARRRIHAANKITSYEDGMRDIEAFAKLEPEEAKELTNLLATFLSVTKDRNVLRYQLTDFDKGVDAIARLEDDATAAIPKIQESERMHRILKRDVAYIEGEKADLEYERETLVSGMMFAKKISLGATLLLTLAVLALGYFALVQGNPVFYPAAALTLAAMLIFYALLMFRRRIVFEFKLNAKKQARAVELMNTKVAVLAYHTNFLNFAYKKYKVRNSQALIRNLSEYDRYKHVTSRLDSIRDIMYETESRIEQFLREKNINSGRFSIEQFARNIDIDDKQRYYRQLSIDRQKQEDMLQGLDSRHNDIWDYTEMLRENDKTGVIEAMAQMYMDEVALVLGEASEETEPGSEDAPEIVNDELSKNEGAANAGI
ncbi:MAG: hypothetical protein FWE68_01290 [Defluviitaleaceae bacterium]|nr:hypothetical protein [Defluviitaleaceae bacterium]